MRSAACSIFSSTRGGENPPAAMSLLTLNTVPRRLYKCPADSASTPRPFQLYRYHSAHNQTSTPSCA